MLKAPTRSGQAGRRQRRSPSRRWRRPPQTRRTGLFPPLSIPLISGQLRRPGLRHAAGQRRQPGPGASHAMPPTHAVLRRRLQACCSRLGPAKGRVPCGTAPWVGRPRRPQRWQPGRPKAELDELCANGPNKLPK